MVKDLNKNIGNIEYNHLNLPTKITFQLPMTGEYIEYTYDAAGVKLEKAIQYSNTLGQSRTQYDGNFIYEYTGAANPELKFFSHAEGYFEPTGTSPLGEMEGAYVYQYKDHSCLRRLTEVRRDGEEGTVRLSYSDTDNSGSVSSSEIVEENNYYPFGLKHKGYNNVINGTDHKYGFGGKEEQSELGLEWMDFHARNYDASLGRWMNIDPLAEKMRRHSPYNFAFNNPIYWTDPDGMAPDDYIFNENGDHVRIDENDEPDQIVIENSQSCEVDATYEFNDPENDTEAIKEKKITKVKVISEKQINQQMIDNGSTTTSENSLVYIERESRPPGDDSVFSGKSSGNLDHVSSANSIVRDENTLNLVAGNGSSKSGVAYNQKDFGNFLWGQAGKKLGFGIRTLQIVAHGNNAINGDTDNPGLDTGILDSKYDQKAIRAGYYFPNFNRKPMPFIFSGPRF